MHTLKLGKLIYCDTSIKNKRPILAIIIVMAIWIIASTMSYNDAQRAEIEYCQHVRDGLWPDYKGIYDKVCEEEL